MAANSDSGRGSRTVKAGPPPSTSDVVPSAAKTVESPERKFLGKYKLEKALGAGGMGTVYLATDMELRRQVALKILPKDKAENPRLVQRFESEGKAAAALRHENIVAVWDAGKIDGLYFIAMEYVEGNDVHQLMAKRGIIPVRRSVEIVTQVAKALEHAWQKKIVHRDIKPSNLMVRRDGVVKLADLGLARAIDDSTETNITRAGTTVGTVDYMAPEQARDSKAADIRSDIYSLGCTWYHMLTGKPPFPDGSLTNKLHAHAAKAPPDPRTDNDHIPDAVVAVMHRMMAKKPNDRYQDPEELLEDLQRATLGRENVSNSVLAALAEADSSEALPASSRGPSTPTVEQIPTSDPTKKKKKLPERGRATPVDDGEEDPQPARPSKKSGSGSASSHILPPREKKKKDGEEDEESTPQGDDERKRALVKYLLVGGLVAVCLGAVGYVSKSMSSAVDVPVTKNPFEGAEGTDGNPNTTVIGEDAQKKKAAAQANRPGTAPDRPGQPSDDPRTSVAGGTPTGTAPSNGPKITIGREDERPHIPSWVAGLPLKGDVAQLEKSKALPVLTLGRTGDGKPSQFATLAQAFDALPKSGGIVQLHGPGPFFLRPTELTGKTRLILAAAEGSRPVVMLLPDAAGAGSKVLRVSGMTLELLGVHLTCVARQFPSTDELTLIEVSAGDVSVRQCSLTLQGNRPGSTVALRVAGEVAGGDRRPPNGPRVLLDRTFFRGDRLTSTFVGAPAVDFVASACLFATGEAPSLALREPLQAPTKASPVNPAGSKAKAGDARSTRTLRYLSCTLCGSGSAFDLSPTNAEGSLPDTSLLLMNGVVAVERPDSKAALFEVGAWPAAVTPVDDQPSYRNLQCEAPTTVFPGWSRLVSGKVDASNGAVGATAWRQTFGNKVLETQFLGAWPGRALQNVGALAPVELDTASLDSKSIKPEGGGFCGCKADDLSIPSDETLARTDALADRPIAAPVIPKTPDAATAVVTIDAGKEDLGRAVSNGSWKSGATLKVTSSKGNLAKSSPISLKGRSARIEIEPTLTIETRENDFRGSNAPEAFLSTGGGSLEIVGGRFRVPASTKGESPKWLIQVEGGGFLIEDCVLQGPMIPTNRFEGMVRWTRPGNEPVKANPAGRYERYGTIRSCFIACQGKCFGGDLRGGGLVVQNAAVASLDLIFDFNLAGPDGKISGAVDLRDSTFSALNGVFNVRGAALSNAADSPLKVFSERCAFVSSVDAGGAAAKPVLMQYTGKTRAEKQIDWWGSTNAYGDEFRTWLKGEAEPTGDQEFDRDWSAAWGPGHELRPLLGRGVAVTRGGFKPKLKVAAGDFEMDVASPAGRWNVDGGPIGPTIASLGESDSPKPTTPATVGGGTKKPEKPTAVAKPDF